VPRTGRGGARTGTPTTAYGNRTDLNAGMPVQTAPGQGYGKAAEQQVAQRAIPMGSLPKAAPSAPVSSGAGMGRGQAVATTPAQMPDLFGPTQRPDEPPTHGSNVGPGAGPEILGLQHQARASAADMIHAMANSPYATQNILELSHYIDHRVQ